MIVSLERTAKRVAGWLSTEFLLATALAIILAVCPMTWLVKGFLFVALVSILLELARRSALQAGWKIAGMILIVVVVAISGFRISADQYQTDALIADYKTKRDLVAKFQAHDESLKRIVEQYDRQRRAQSLFESFLGFVNPLQRAAIDREGIEDIENALNHFDVIATPMGDGLRIKLGLNMYRIIYPVPMRIVPTLSFSGLPSGVTSKILEQSNLGATVIFLPLSVPVEHFGFSASAEL